MGDFLPQHNTTTITQGGTQRRAGNMVTAGTSFEFDDLFSSSPPPAQGQEAGSASAGAVRKKQVEMSAPQVHVKLEKSRQSARECRARKKLRYQYLDDMISEREKANMVLREELQKYVSWCQELDSNQIPDGLEEFLRSSDHQRGKPVGS